MEDKKPILKYEQLGLPKQIMLNGQNNSFKKELAKSYLSYRCIHRHCKCSIKIGIDMSKTIESKDNEESNINFTINGSHANHPIEKNIEENLQNIKNEKEINEITKKNN